MISTTVLAIALQASPAIDRQAAFERRLFAEAGFAPISERAVAGRRIRRLVLHDPYIMLAVPAVAIEREADGRTTLTIRYRRWQSDPVLLPAGAWESLIALEAPVFMLPPPAPPRDPAAQPPITHCHGWIARLATEADRTTSWSQCGSRAGDEKLPYLQRFVAIALATRPACDQTGEDPFWAFQRCFEQGMKLDDPALDSRFAALLTAWGAVPGSDRLSEARLALRAAEGAALGSPAWLSARDAVARFKTMQDERQAIINDLKRLNGAAMTASPGDRARIGELLQAWSGWMPSQDRNYIGLTDALVWPVPGATSAAPASPR